MVVIKPEHYKWQEWYDEFEAYYVYDLTTGTYKPTYSYLHLLTLMNTDAREVIKDFSNIAKVRACKALSIPITITYDERN